MHVINPLGRSVETEILANNSVRACMCKDDNTFASARTTADTCSHCGCQCGWILSDGNYTTANNAGRTSSL